MNEEFDLFSFFEDDKSKNESKELKEKETASLKEFKSNENYKEKVKESKLKKEKQKPKPEKEKILDELKAYSKVVLSIYGVQERTYEGEQVAKIDLDEITKNILCIKYREFSQDVKWAVVPTNEKGECYLIPQSSHFKQKG